MLFRIYNKLFEAFRLDKNISIDDKYLDVRIEDFKPDLFNNEEIGRYIEIMIADMKPVSSGKLLRETVACANMMVRMYLKDKVNLRYDPVNTFKDLKMLMESKEEKILKLSEQNKNLEIQVDQLFLEKKHLMSEIKHLQFQMSYARNRNVSKSKPSKKGLTKSSSLPKTSSTRLKVNLKTQQEFYKRHTIDSKEYVNSSESESNTIEKKTSLRQKGLTKSQDFLDEKEANKFKDLKESKNRDKLIKSHGYQNLVSNLNGFRELVEHTNRLFLYKAKMTAKHKNHLKVDKFQPVTKKYRPLSSSKSAVFQNRLKDDIVNKLNGLINIIEKSDNN